MSYLTDPERLHLLMTSELLDSASEEAYDRFTGLAALLLNIPISLISLVERDRQYFKSVYGLLPEAWASQQQTPLLHSFCQYMVTSHQPLIVADARVEPGFQDNLALPDLDLVAYLGFPLEVHDQVLGSLCVIDHRPHQWSQREILVMQELSRCVATEVALRIEMRERQLLSEQLHASEERFRTLVNQAPIIIWQADARGEMIACNRSWCTFTGFSEQQSLGVGWLAAVHPEDRVHIPVARLQAFEKHMPYQSEFRLRRVDGVYREMITRSSPWINPATGERGYIGTTSDVTEQKALERQREKFFSMATHELKSPLTVLHARIQMVQRRLGMVEQSGELSSERQKTLTQAVGYLRQSRELIQMQDRLINDLLDLARGQTGKLMVRLIPIDLVQVVQEMVQEQQNAVPQRLITLELPEQTPIWVLADTQRICQVLSNYLSNALKYSSVSSPIVVGVSVETTGVRVWVRDQGIGLSELQQVSVWEPFYQTQEVTVAEEYSPSLGLGLSICRDLILEHHGEVGVESRRGEGSTFWFLLPMLPFDRSY